MRGTTTATTSAEPADIRVSPITVQSQTVAKLKEAILSGVFSPGERLVESTLCLRMGVSRTSIREALRRLEAERLVTNSPNRGPSVAEVDWKGAEEIYEVRALLEGQAAALCAERATPEVLADILHALEEFDLAVASGAALERIRSTERFYGAILRGCGNTIIQDVVEGLIARISFLRAQSMSREGRSSHSAVEMRNIYEGIASGNAATARAAAIEHVKNAAAAARKVFADQAKARSAAAKTAVPADATA
ncbi:GntR family transcriptional regulator [soil metagenome]